MRFQHITSILAAAVFSFSAPAHSADSVLAVSSDNDLFAPTQTDRDYTAGLAVTYSSNSRDFLNNPAARVSQSLDRLVLPYSDAQVGKPDSQLKVTYFGSAGYLTEFGAALVFRSGLISSPDNRFNPELMAYGESAPGVAAPGGSLGGIHPQFCGWHRAELRVAGAKLGNQAGRRRQNGWP